MRRLLLGRLVSSALSVAAQLRVADLLADGPRTAEELAVTTGTQAPALCRVLRTLAAFDVLAEDPDGRFALTPLGETLRSDVPGTAWPTALLAAGEIGQAWDGLLDTVRTGKPAFDRMFGTDVFTYFGAQPELRATFYASQAADLEVTLTELDAIDVTAHRTVVDVGGGDGALLAHLLAAAPQARGVLLDSPAVVAEAQARMAAAGLSDRCEVVAGDFFTAIPGDGDLYLMRDVLHDWPDERCVQLLRTCHRAMPDTATLAVIERVADPDLSAGADAQLTALMDLYMLAVLDGRERSREELERLLTGAGFAVGSWHRLSRGTALVEATPR
nr:putative O-methyltransferase [uncultured bacterium]